MRHLKEMEKAGLPTPAVNQIELNPFWRLEDIVNHCTEKGIVIMGYCPLFHGRKNDDLVLVEMASRSVSKPKHFKLIELPQCIEVFTIFNIT